MDRGELISKKIIIAVGVLPVPPRGRVSLVVAGHGPKIGRSPGTSYY